MPEKGKITVAMSEAAKAADLGAALTKLAANLKATKDAADKLDVALAAGTNPNWDPKDHPHGKHGKFVKKGSAVYYALTELASAQAYKKKTYTGKPGVYTTQHGPVKVGGFSITPPAGALGPVKTIDYELKPGEKFYTVTTPTQQYGVVEHVDGTATMLHATDASLVPEAKALSKLPAVGHNYEVTQQDEYAPLPSLPKPTSVAQLEAAIPGTQIVVTTKVAKDKIVHTKQPSEKWKSGKSGDFFDASKYAEAIAHGSVEWVPSVSAAAVPAKAAPAPAKQAEGEVVTKTHLEYHEGNSNKFYESAVVSHPDGSATHVTRFGSTLPGAYVAENAKKYEHGADALSAHIKVKKSKVAKGYLPEPGPSMAFDAQILKVAGVTAQVQYGGAPAVEKPTPSPAKAVTMYSLDIGTPIKTKEHADALPAGTHVYFEKVGDTASWAEYERQQDGSWKRVKGNMGALTASHASFANTVVHGGTTAHIVGAQTLEPQPVQAAPAPALVAAGGKLVGDGVLHHQTGTPHALKPGDVVYQHNKVVESFLIMHDDGTSTKVNKAGKAQKAPENLIALKDVNYKLIHTEPKITAPYLVPGTTVVLEPGMTLYRSKGNPNYWAIVKNDNVDILIHKETGEIKKPPATWQASYDKHTLIKVASHPSTGEAAVSAAPAAKVVPEKAPAAKAAPAAPSIEHVAKGALKAAPKKPSLVNVSPNKSFTLHNGKVFTPPAGGHLLKDEASNAYWMLSSFGKVTLYNADGSEATYWSQPKGKKTLAGLLKQNKILLASGPEKQVAALPVGDPGVKTFKTHSELIDFAADHWYHSRELGKELTLKMTGLPPAIEGETGQYAALGTAAATKLHADYAAALTAGRDKFKDGLSSSQKLKLGKAIKYTTNMARASLLMERLYTAGHQVDESDEAELAALLNDKGSEPKFFSGPLTVVTKAQTLLEQKKFAQTVTHLGFDPSQATHEQSSQYVATHGAAHVIGGMTPAQAKTWMLLDLNAPGTTGTKDAIEQSAAVSLKAMAVAANAKAVAAKKAALASPADEAATKAKTAHIAADYKTLSSMVDVYEGPKGALLLSGSEGWSLLEPGNLPIPLDALSAADVSKQPGWKATGKKIGSPAQQTAKKLNADYGTAWTSADQNTLAALGLNATLSYVDRIAWLHAYLRGDQIAMANLGYETANPEHPGSKESPEGQLARQSLANYLAAQTWWHPYADAMDHAVWTDADVAAADEALGLSDAAHARNPQPGGLTPRDLLSEWIASHQGLPDGVTNLVKHEKTPVFGLAGAETKMAAPTDYVFQHSTTGAAVIIGDDGWWSSTSKAPAWHYNPFASSVKYSSKDDMQGKLAANGQWVDISGAHAPAATPGLKVDKPANVSQQAWDTATGAEAGGAALKELLGTYATMSDEDVAAGIAASSATVGLTVAVRLKLASAPDPLQRLALWAGSAEGLKNRDLARDVVRSIVVKLDGGEYITPETQTYSTGTGEVTIPPGASLHKLGPEQGYYVAGGHYALITGPKSGFVINASGSPVSYVYAYDVAKYMQGEKVAESFAALNPAKAALEGFAFTDAAWEALGKAESAKWTKADAQEAAAAYSFKVALGEGALKDKYGSLVAKMHSLPAGVKQLAVEAAEHQDTDTLTAILWKVGKGVYASAPQVTAHPVVDPSAPYAQFVKAGKVSAGDVEKWSSDAMQKFAEDYGLNSLQLYAHLAQDIAAKLVELGSANQEKTTTSAPSLQKAAAATGDTFNLELVLTGKKLGGMHSKDHYVDQYADEWMSKSFPNDPNGPARVDAEHYANVAGRLLGFHQPQTFVRTLENKYSYVQHLDDALPGEMKGVSPADLNDDQLAGAMQEQVLDWLISNHDSNEKNLLRAPDGKTIIGIDKGQAWKNLHLDKLKPGWLPKENPAPQWYDQFFTAVTTGKISQERAEFVARSVLLKAYQAQTRHDERYEELVTLATAKRTSFPAKWPNQKAFVEAAMARKHSLTADFAKLYEDVWKQAGWTWTIDPADFGKKVGDAHVQNGPQFAEELAAAKAPGLALMFNSRDLLDSHMMLTPMHVKKGKPTLLGSARLTTQPDKSVTKWLKERVEGKLAQGSKAQAPPVIPPNADLPGISTLHEANVAFLITVKTHAPGGTSKADGAYNADTVAAAENAVTVTRDLLDTVLAARKKDPTKPHSTFETLEQQEAWIAAAKKKIREYELTKKAYDQGVPVSTLYPKEVPFDAISYVPTKGLGKPGGIAESWKTTTGLTFVRTTDGGHYAITADGTKEWVSAEEYANAAGAEGAVKQPLTDTKGTVGKESWTNTKTGVTYTKQDDGEWHVTAGFAYTKQLDDKTMADLLDLSTDAWTHDGGATVADKTVEVQVAGKKFKVTHHTAVLHAGTVDYKTGELHQTKAAAASTFQTATEYVVEHGKVSVRYRPWTEPGIAKPQQGLLSFEIDGWDGSPAQIDDVLDTLAIMGVDVTPADEQSVELAYWRHVTDQVKIDGSKNPQKIRQVVTDVSAAIAANPKMSAVDELEVLKKAWTTAIGKQAMEEAAWQPSFNAWFGAAGGRPMWYRPDVSIEQLRKLYGNGKNVPVHSVTGSDTLARAVKVVQSGGLLPSEERMRVLGELLGGMSSTQDQHGTGAGSSGHVFTRQNTSPQGDYAFLIDPRESLRAANYACPGDKFGNRAQAVGTFDVQQMFSQSGHNEMMIKDGVSVAYGVAGSEALRQKWIAALKAAGTTEVNGMSVEEFVLGPTQWKAKMAEMWARVMTEMAAAKKVAA